MRTLSPLDALLHPVRLACLIHAASVHSEPGSNSPWKKFSFFRKRFDLLIQVLHSKLGDAPESHIRTGTPRTSHCAVQFPKIGGGLMALQFLPSFGGVAVTLARPEGFASRPAEKRRKIPPFFREKEGKWRIQPMAGHLTRQVPTKGRRGCRPPCPPENTSG